MRRRWIGALLLSTACAAAKSTPPAASPAAPSPGGAAGSPASPAPPAASPPSPPGASIPGQPGAAGTHAVMVAQALADLDVGQRTLDVAAGDCRNACRALGSMDRAAGHLCALAQGEEETRHCDDAKRQVLVAREKVKRTCGMCDDGTAVDRDVPVPQSR